MGSDPFATGVLRERVLRAWGESPARFREDANAEEDYALGGYRDRVVIELAQNAADAALRAGVPGRLRLALDEEGGEPVLVAANTGLPLDVAGVEALSTLRASAKRDEPGTVGRFGVGFAAVVAVSGAPMIASKGREPTGVEWSETRARELVEELPSLAGELERRGGQVPLLRLPFAVPQDAVPDVPEGFDTVVRLPLRDEAAGVSVRAQLEQAGPALLLALPALGTVEIEIAGVPVRTLTAEEGPPGTLVINGLPWRTAEAHGEAPAELLADRPVEERGRPAWQVRWALPEPGASDVKGLPEGVPAVVHAPTPSDERLGLRALLIASFPLAPDRRHVAPGPLTDFLVERAAEAYAGLLRDLPTSPRLLDLVPGPVAEGELDARIRRAILSRLPDVPLLPVAGEEQETDEKAPRARGRDTVVLDGPPALTDLLSGESGTVREEPIVPGLLPSAWPVRHAALDALGVRRVELADVVDELAGLDRPPAWWRRLYGTLVEASSDSLGALPVPLAPEAGTDDEPGRGVRIVRGPRGLLVAADGVDPAGLGALGLRFVHPDADHPLLLRLGAVEAGPRAVLADPAVRATVDGSYEAEDPEEVAAAVLGLVAAAHLDPGEEPWLAELALPGADGDLYPAGELLLPGSPLRDLMAEDAPFGVVADGLVERWGTEPLAAAGVLDGFALAHAEDVGLSALADLAEEHDLDGEDAWAEEILERLEPQELPPIVPEFQGVRDLELVGDWDAALRLLAGPPWRAAIVQPAQVALHDGRRVAVPSYTAWWLRTHPILDGRRPGEFRLDDPETGDLLDGLYDPVPPGAPKDRELLLALGVRTSLGDLLAEPGGARELLERLGDPSRTISRAHLSALWTSLADAHADAHAPAYDSAHDARQEGVEPPERVRAVVDGWVEVADAADALVLDRPDALPLLAGQPLVIAAGGRAGTLAELLDLPLAGEEVPGTVESAGTRCPVPVEVRAVLPDAPTSYFGHDPLVVDGQSVPWWCGDDGEVHADGPWGLARALAWAAGRWEDRLLVETLLRDPDALPVLQAEADLDED